MSTHALAQETDVREVPIYSMAEAARYLKLAPATVRSWLKGRPYRAGGAKQWSDALIDIADSEGSLLSFNNLVEAHVLKALRRRHGVPMHGVRVALDYALEKYGIHRLFLSDELRTVEYKEGDEEAKTVGALFLKKLGEVEQISAGGQIVLREVLTRHLARVERDAAGWPVQLYPFIAQSEEKAVLIDPKVSFGRPVLAKRGIRISTLVDRVEANEDPSDIANDYGLETYDVIRALEFEQAA